jgi:hypothetical protein
MSEPEMAAELARLRDQLVELEAEGAPQSHDPGAPRYNAREITRVRARIAELEADLGI